MMRIQSLALRNGFQILNVTRCSSCLSLKTTNPNQSISRHISTTKVRHINPLEVVEPTFYSQGLGTANPWPPGLAQFFMEQIYVGTGLPWWGTIVTTTVILRIALFPFFIKTRRFIVRQSNLSPELAKFQEKMMMARTQEEALRNNLEMKKFMQENNIGPSNYFSFLANGAVLTTMFFALRGMANLPVESLKTGGALWFTDLTLADPFYLLPLITVSSLYINFKVGGEGIDLNSQPKFMRNFINVMILVSFPVMCSFPAALNVYWLSSNLFTITQGRLLSKDAVRKYFGIEKPNTKPGPSIFELVEKAEQKKKELRKAAKDTPRNEHHEKILEKMKQGERKR